MALKRRGRPRDKQEALDAALMPLGGLDKVLSQMIETATPCRKIADTLARLGGVRVAPNTVLRWAHELHAREAATRGSEHEGQVTQI